MLNPNPSLFRFHFLRTRHRRSGMLFIEDAILELPKTQHGAD